MTRLLRDLADGERTVLLVTHSLQSLDLCDRVLFLAPGGRTAFFGSPEGVLPYFAQDGEAARFPEVFRALDEHRDRDWATEFAADPAYNAFIEEPLSRAEAVRPQPIADGKSARRPHSFIRHVSVLTRRYLAVLASDRRNVALLALQAPLFGALYLLLVGPDRLTTSYGSEATMLLWLLIIGATWLGTANAIREVVKERSIVRRETAIGVSAAAYLASKVAVLVLITVLQTTVLVLVAMATQTLPPRDPTGAVAISGVGSLLDSQVMELLIGVALAGIAAMALGLLISCIVRSSDRALVLLPLILITQVVLSEPFFEAYSPVLRSDSAGMISSAQWGMSELGSTLSLNDLRSVQLAANKVGRDALFADTPHPVDSQAAIESARTAGVDRWRHDANTWLTSAGLLLLMTLGCLILSLVILRRPDAAAPGREQA